jgi:hypothetical protein
VHSFGRRRRSANSTLETSEEPEPAIDVTGSEENSNSSQDALDFTSSTQSDINETTAINNATTSEDEEVDSGEDPGDIHVKLLYILESNPHPFCSFRGLKNQMRIRVMCGLESLAG